MSKRKKKILIIIFSLCFLFFTIGTVLGIIEHTNNEIVQEEYNELTNAFVIANAPDKENWQPQEFNYLTETEELSVQQKESEVQNTKQTQRKSDDMFDNIKVDYASLKKQNSDYIGWIHLGTGASYPIVQGKTIDDYLRVSFKKTKSTGGCIMLHPNNAPDFSDRNSVIYGHNMRNGTMFGQNKRYTDLNYLRLHPYFWIHVEDGYYVYQIFSCVITSDMTEVYRTGMVTDKHMAEYLEAVKPMAKYWLDEVKVTDSDSIVSLSTCYGAPGTSVRMVLQGKLLTFVSYGG